MSSFFTKTGHRCTLLFWRNNATGHRVLRTVAYTFPCPTDTYRCCACTFLIMAVYRGSPRGLESATYSWVCSEEANRIFGLKSGSVLGMYSATHTGPPLRTLGTLLYRAIVLCLAVQIANHYCGLQQLSPVSYTMKSTTPTLQGGTCSTTMRTSPS